MFLSKYLQIFQEFHLGTFLTNSLELIIFLRKTFVNPAQVMTQSTLKQTRVINVLTCGSYNKPWFCLRSTCLSGYFFLLFFSVWLWFLFLLCTNSCMFVWWQTVLNKYAKLISVALICGVWISRSFFSERWFVTFQHFLFFSRPPQWPVSSCFRIRTPLWNFTCWAQCGVCAVRLTPST